jgi:hypothetical protein
MACGSNNSAEDKIFHALKEAKSSLRFHGGPPLHNLPKIHFNIILIYTYVSHMVSSMNVSKSELCIFLFLKLLSAQLTTNHTPSQRYCVKCVKYEVLSYVMLPSARFEVFMAVTMKNGVFWDVMPCRSCKNRRFGRT